MSILPAEHELMGLRYELCAGKMMWLPNGDYYRVTDVIRYSKAVNEEITRLAAAHASLVEENRRLREALEPFAAVAEHDIGEDETDNDVFRPMTWVNARARVLTVGDFRRARSALTSEQPVDGGKQGEA